MDVLHGDLEAVEAAGLGDLHLGAEVLSQILVDDAVGSGKEGQDIFDEVAFVVVEFLPVTLVLKISKLLERGRFLRWSRRRLLASCTFTRLSGT